MHRPHRTALATLALSLGLLLSTAGCVAQRQPASQTQQAAKNTPAVQRSATKDGVVFLGYVKNKKGEDIHAYDMRKDKPFAPLYKALLKKHHIKDSWLANFDGPSTPITRVSINGQEFLHLNFCKAHSCSANNIELLYNEKEQILYALLSKDYKGIWLGDPSLTIRQGLVRLETIEPPR